MKRYNDSGIDKLLIFDLSEDEQEHEKNILAIKELNRLVEVPVCAGGNISRTEDIKKLLYAGCQQVMLNSTKPVTARLAEEAGARFGHLICREPFLRRTNSADETSNLHSSYS